MQITRNTFTNIEQYASFNSFDLVIFQKKNRCGFKKRINCQVLLETKKLCILMSKVYKSWNNCRALYLKIGIFAPHRSIADNILIVSLSSML